MPTALTETLTTTSKASLCPWFWKLTVNAGVVPPGTWLLTPFGCSVTLLTTTDVRPWPQVFGQEPLEAEPAPATPSRSPTVVGDNQVSSGRNWLTIVVWPLMS